MSSTFYSAPRMLPHRLQIDDSISYLGTNNPGLFATLAPDWSQTPGIMPGSSSTGLGFMFRVNNTFSGEIVSVDIWGDWGAANTPFSGTMTIANQSISSMGMVEGYSLQTSIGDITFVNASAVPLPAGIYLFLSGLVGLGLMRGRNG